MPTSAEEKSLKTAMDELLHENACLRGDLLTMAHRICHDLRTPLGSINVSTELIKEIGSEGTNISRATIDSIFGATDEIVRLLERVSFLLKASAKPVSLETIKMGSVVFDARQKLERLSLKKNAIIHEPDGWPEVNGVASWLRVIWWNLLANALQHAPDGMKIRLDWKREEDTFRFWIEDNGDGVPEEKAARLFQGFNTLHEPEAKKGLGLAIVRRLVELQHGRCGYISIKPHGALFYFTLPLRQPHATTSSGKPAESDHQARISMAGASH